MENKLGASRWDKIRTAERAAFGGLFWLQRLSYVKSEMLWKS